MSILSVDQISPIGSGTTITLNATEVKTGTEITVGTGASIFSPAGNTLTLGTNNVERIRIKNDGKVGIATISPRATLDVEGDTRLKSYHEAPVTLTSSGQVVNIDLSKGQTFELTTTENIVEFRISNFVADMATSFTIKILQGSTARTVDIDDFKNSAGSASIPVNWPGGVVPTVTASAGAVDIYSFMTFDGGDRLYGIVGGQNFL